MAKYKLRQYAEVESFENVYHHVQLQEVVPDFPLKGKWLTEHFKNNNPIVLELGCGKGEYTVNMAREFKDKNFIGVDIKGNRLWTGAKIALAEHIDNTAFLRIGIENITTAFEANEVDEIWVTFPDPHPQDVRSKKRLTSIPFLNRYKQLLKPGGIIHLKTDSSLLYNFTLEVIAELQLELLLKTDNLYSEPAGFLGPHHNLLVATKTHYEKKFSAMGFSINYIRFRL